MITGRKPMESAVSSWGFTIDVIPKVQLRHGAVAVGPEPQHRHVGAHHAAEDRRSDGWAMGISE